MKNIYLNAQFTLGIRMTKYNRKKERLKSEIMASPRNRKKGQLHFKKKKKLQQMKMNHFDRIHTQKKTTRGLRMNSIDLICEYITEKTFVTKSNSSVIQVSTVV